MLTSEDINLWHDGYSKDRKHWTSEKSVMLFSQLTENCPRKQLNVTSLLKLILNRSENVVGTEDSWVD